MEVIVLDGRDVPNPEDMAMIQALYSRDPQSVKTHIARVRERGSGSFMGRYYVGYGHKSIGDCGTITLCFENVSLLAAKAIQDWPLYNGQEASTRYLDFSKQSLINHPLAGALTEEVQWRWMRFYTDNFKAVWDHVCARYPRQINEDKGFYEKAVTARTFDIMRAFLPAGVTTFVSWHTNLRQAADHLALLVHHPLAEVRDLATTTLNQLREKYPNSFSFKEYPATEAYRALIGSEYTYHGNCEAVVLLTAAEFRFTPPCYASAFVSGYKHLIMQRPPKTELPHFLSGVGVGGFDYYLDFGSYRDAQRHRNGVNCMPVLTTDFGFHPWYLEQLPEAVRAAAVQLIAEQTRAIDSLDFPLALRQYYCALGYLVPCHVRRGLPGLVYEAELRSSKAVHPTYRRIAQKMAQALKGWCPELAIHADMDPDDWDVRRGTHDIVVKPT